MNWLLCNNQIVLFVSYLLFGIKLFEEYGKNLHSSHFRPYCISFFNGEIKSCSGKARFPLPEEHWINASFGSDQKFATLLEMAVGQGKTWAVRYVMNLSTYVGILYTLIISFVLQMLEV